MAAEPNQTLAQVLRDELNLTGTKVGCDMGTCGCCTVLIDGRARLSCLTLALECEGASVTTIEGLSPDGSHPSWGPHPTQGWSPDFIPKLAEDAQAAQFVDEVVSVDGPNAFSTSIALAQQEGIFVGISAGATLFAALEIAGGAPKGSKILAMLPDTGERYLSTPLFKDISVEMTDEEIAIAGSG